MDELVSHLTLARITNVTIKRRHKCLTIGGEEESRCGCGVSVIHGGIPHDGAFPPARGAHGGGQYPWPEGGGGLLELRLGWLAEGGGGQLYAGGGGCGSHVEGCPVVGDPPHGITGVGPI
jgi:hypothetical protein